MRTFTQLVGTTDTTSPSTYGNAFTTLANNNSAQGVAIGKALINDQARYLIQKYFDNERTVTTSTVGGASYTLTGVVALNATSATLSSSWTQITCNQLVNFSNGNQRSVLFTNGSASITWTVGLTSAATASIATTGVQDYNIPANISKIKNDTISVGQLKYQPTFVQTRQEWDLINFLPYTSDIPNYCFIHNGKLSIFPIPSTTGNILTFNYKTRVADMTFADYSTGNIAASGMIAGSTTVTGLNTAWSTTGAYPIGVDIGYLNLYLRADPPNGDGIWYPISSFVSATSLILGLPVVSAPNVTAATTYTIGQMPLLSEDFHDLIVYQALKVYYSTVVPDSNRFKEFSELAKDRLDMLKDYAGTKSVNVDLEAEPQQVNPNLFIYANS